MYWLLLIAWRTRHVEVDRLCMLQGEGRQGLPVNPEASSRPTKHCCAMVCLMAERVALILPVACKQNRQCRRTAVQLFATSLTSADTLHVIDQWMNIFVVLHPQRVRDSALHHSGPQWTLDRDVPGP